VAVGDFGGAGFDLFAGDLAGEFFGRDGAVAVHEDDEGFGVFVLEDQGFYHGVLGYAEFARRYAGAAVCFVGVWMWGVGDLMRLEELGRGGFGRVGAFAHGCLCGW